MKALLQVMARHLNEAVSDKRLRNRGRERQLLEDIVECFDAFCAGTSAFEYRKKLEEELDADDARMRKQADTRAQAAPTSKRRSRPAKLASTRRPASTRPAKRRAA